MNQLFEKIESNREKSEKSGKIREIISCQVGLILRWGPKNRITALSYVGIILPILYSSISIDDSLSPFTYILQLSGGLCAWVTAFGTTTERTYRRTCDHIEKKWKIGRKFFKKIMKNDIDKEIMGYCQLQWMYLAAKEYWLEKKFLEMKKEFTNNLIPNF